MNQSLVSNNAFVITNKSDLTLSPDACFLSISSGVSHSASIKSSVLNFGASFLDILYNCAKAYDLSLNGLSLPSFLISSSLELRVNSSKSHH